MILLAVSRRPHLPDREPRRDGRPEHRADAETATSRRTRTSSPSPEAAALPPRSRRRRASSTRARSRRPSSTRSSRRRWRPASAPSLRRGARTAPLRTASPHRDGALGSSDVRSRRRPAARRGRPAAAQDPPDRGVDRRHAPRPRRPAPRGDRRLGLVRGPVGHAHRDLDRLHHPGLPLPGAADGAHGARLVRDPPLRVSGRRHVHARARGLRDGRRAQQLRAREHGHAS